MIDMPEGFDWPAPWKPFPLPDGWLGRVGRVSSAEAELKREICPGHVLYGRTCRAVAYNPRHGDEFLFVTDDQHNPIAFVHLTWQTERDPKWPYTVTYSGWDALRLTWSESHE
jgi:hypothetical protein